MSGKITESFLELLRAGLWQTVPNASLLEGFTQQDWRMLWLAARKQTVQGLVYYGVNLLPQDHLPQIMTLASWMVEIERISQDNEKINSVISKQSDWWNSSNINAVVMKGQTVADFYPDPSLRISGDVDWYFPTSSDWERSIYLSSEKGCSLDMDSDGDYHYSFDKVVIEHHKSSSELSSKSSLRELQKIESFESWRSVKKLAPLSNLLLLNTHLLKHAMIAGIGLRQFCDIAMSYKYYFSEGNNIHLANEYYKEINKLGLSKWTALLHTFLVDHLGMPEDYLPFPLENKFDTSWLLSEVLKDGNFGQNQKSSMISKIFRKFLFSLSYAPKEYFARFFSLAVGRTKLLIGNNR